tara:strand:+ start:60 stop:296 length:237 start_codon:yes stop_codon:yes gene_type:complete
MQSLTDGKQRVEIGGANIRQIIDNLEQKFPGFKDRVVEDGRVKPNISIAVDGEITPLGLIQKIHPDSEIHFLPAISGG